MSGWLGRRAAAALAGEIETSTGARQRQNARVHQRVVDHHVGLAQRMQCAHGEQSRIARPGADEPDRTRRQLGQCQFG